MLAMASVPIDDRLDDRDDLVRMADVLVGPQELRVRLAAVDWSQPRPVPTAIATRLDDHPLLAADAMQAVAHALSPDQTAWGVHSLGSAADELIGGGSEGAGGGGARDRPVGRRSVRLARALARPPTSPAVPPSADVAAFATRVWTATE